MYQNIIALHAANGMLDKDTDLTQGFLGSLLIIAQLRVRVLLTLARLLYRDFHLITTVGGLNTEITSVDPNMDICKPVHRRRTLLFQHAVIVMVAAKRPPQKDHKLVRERHDRVLQRLLCFFSLSCARGFVASVER